MSTQSGTANEQERKGLTVSSTVFARIAVCVRRTAESSEEDGRSLVRANRSTSGPECESELEVPLTRRQSRAECHRSPTTTSASWTQGKAPVDVSVPGRTSEAWRTKTWMIIVDQEVGFHCSRIRLVSTQLQVAYVNFSLDNSLIVHPKLLHVIYHYAFTYRRLSKMG